MLEQLCQLQSALIEYGKYKAGALLAAESDNTSKKKMKKDKCRDINQGHSKSSNQYGNKKQCNTCKHCKKHRKHALAPNETKCFWNKD